jgi:hypothetical protein
VATLIIHILAVDSKIQTSAHDNDTVTIVATDVAGNETEQLITVSVKIFTRGFAINGKNVNDESDCFVS